MREPFGNGTMMDTVGQGQHLVEDIGQESSQLVSTVCKYPAILEHDYPPLVVDPFTFCVVVLEPYLPFMLQQLNNMLYVAELNELWRCWIPVLANAETSPNHVTRVNSVWILWDPASGDANNFMDRHLQFMSEANVRTLLLVLGVFYTGIIQFNGIMLDQNGISN